MNDFFTPITGIIFDYNGTIDKYVGDMVMAFLGRASWMILITASCRTGCAEDAGKSGRA